MTEDIIYDEEHEPEVEAPIYDVVPEPVIEPLEREGETIEDVIERHTPYRKQRPQFPLDHLIRCNCGHEGVVGFRQLICPKCNEHLIRPEDAQKTDYVLRRRPRG